MRNAFTLIELLVVIFIISIVSLIIVFKTSQPNTAREARSFAVLLKSQMEMAREEAILQMSVFALDLHSKYYQFYEYINSKDGPAWRPLEQMDSFWKTYKIPANLSLIFPPISTATAENALKTTIGSSSILFYPSGEMTPFNLGIHSKNSKEVIKIIGQPNGSFTLERGSDD